MGGVHPGLAWLEHCDAGSAWLADLPRLVAECAEAWSLEVGEAYPYAYVSLAVPVRRADGSDAVLKVQFPDTESELEGAALGHWDGQGAVRLYAHDADRRALLLERCDPGTPLSAAGDAAALDVLVRLVGRLGVPAGAPFLSLAEAAAGWADRLPGRWEQAGRPCPFALVEAAVELLGALGPSQGRAVLVHQDLHSGNVLAAQREPWLAIDPKPVAGELEFAVAPVVRDPDLGHDPARVRRRLDRLVDELSLDRHRAHGWALAHAMAWGFDGSGVVRPNVEVAGWLYESGA